MELLNLQTSMCISHKILYSAIASTTLVDQLYLLHVHLTFAEVCKRCN